MLAAPLLQEGGIGALGIDLGSLIAYTVNFAVLVAILYFFGYKRILGMLDQRSNRIRESLEEADRVRQEAAEREAAMQRSLQEAHQEAQRQLTEARADAERYREEQAQRAREEANAMIERAREDIQRERDAALEQVRARFADLSVLAAERIVRRSLDGNTHQDLIEEVLAQSDALKG